MLVLGGLGVLVWRALALAAAPATVRGGGTPSPGYSIVSHEPVQQLVNSRLGASLLVLALALVVGALVGYGVAGLRTVLPSPAGRVAGGVGWLLGVLWTPPVPLAMTFASLVVAGAAGAAGAGRMAILALGLGSAVAVLVAVTVGERWRRRAWLAGALAGVGAVGQGLAASAGALVVLEPLVSQPGVGNLLVQSLVRLDVTAVAAAATTLLVVALMGQLVGALAGAFGDWLDVPEPSSTPEGSVLGTVLGVAALVTLVAPVLALAGSLLTGSTTMFDEQHAGMGPSLTHLLGTDAVGRDVLARLLVGFRDAWLISLGSVAIAAMVGLSWGAVAVVLERKLPRGGRVVAEALLAPGRLVMVAPLMVAGLILVGTDRWPAVFALALILAPRLATAVPGLARPSLASVPAMVRTAGGLLLSAWGVALAVLIGQQFVGVGVFAPAPALGGVLAERVPYFVVGAGQSLLAALLVVVLTAPFLLAGWALLRQSPRADAVTTLDA
ncbi:hypothetical protein GCM10009765_74270 [Fodinicola feengrottensis]|uniref:Uncharacterized protein n=1 Tax=Fodinicola feengrottensis TaxID=435914 RepID=A0ABP4UYG1_9ACTN